MTTTVAAPEEAVTVETAITVVADAVTDLPRVR